MDVWLIKTDANGNIQWDKTWGEANNDVGRGVRITADGGYIITGMDESSSAILNDVLLIKTDSEGNTVWKKNFNLHGWDSGLSALQTNDGGYLITGVSSNNPFLLKTDAIGEVEWWQDIPVPDAYGEGYSIEPTFDGGYIICGYNSTAPFLTKTDHSGIIQWTKLIDKSFPQWAGGYAVQQTTDGGYIIAGETNAFSNWNGYLVRTDANGDTLWTRLYGGAGIEWLAAVRQTADGGFVMSGYTTTFGSGTGDVYLVKIIDVQQPGFITGKIYKDDNDNCTYDGSGIDASLVNRAVKAEPGPYFVFTDSNGDFKFKVPLGTYTVSLATVPNDLFGLRDCQTNNSYTVVVAQNATVANLNFAMKALAPGFCSGSVNIISAPFVEIPCNDCDPPTCKIAPTSILSSPCPGYLHRYCATITNTGDDVISPNSTLEITLDPNMSFNSIVSNPCGLSLQQTSPSVIFNIPNSSIMNSNGETCTVCLNVDVLSTPPPPPPNPYATVAVFNPICGMQMPPPTTDVVFDFNFCACDPNDKLVSPQGCGPNGNIAKSEEITYAVRFQNIGTGPAHNVIIKDTIDSDFALYSLRILSSSHIITGVQIEPGNVLVIVFENIELPAKIIDSEGSSGYVSFSLLPESTLSDGAELRNSAAIYFDYNLPVITNTTLNTLYDIPSPVADFSYTRQCAAINNIYDFTYTGGTSDGASYFWNFGTGAAPATSALQNPTGITFTSTGAKEVTLTITRYGCTAIITQIIDVIDVSCGNGKVLVCHSPPGNPENAQLICVSENSVPSHVAHGDCVGYCITPSAKHSNQSNENDIKQSKNFNYKSEDIFFIHPNPTSNLIKINFSVNFTDYVLIELYNYTGQSVAVFFNDIAEKGKQYQLTYDINELPGGIYLTVLKTSAEIKTLKITIEK